VETVSQYEDREAFIGKRNVRGNNDQSRLQRGKGGRSSPTKTGRAGPTLSQVLTVRKRGGGLKSLKAEGETK